jgi:quinol monooxygenase YgiN
MTHSDLPGRGRGVHDTFSRRSALTVFGAAVAMADLAAFAPLASAQRSQQPERAETLSQSSIVNEVVRGGGLLVVSQREAKEGQSEAVLVILRRFLALAQSDPGVRLFLISRGRDNPAQFLFYELFVDDAALAAHQASEYFKSLIVGEALPLLSRRERAQYFLL